MPADTIVAVAESTRKKALLVGAWRGAKLGFIVCLVILWMIPVLSLSLVIFVPEGRDELHRELSRHWSPAAVAWEAAKAAVWFVLAAPLFAILYGAAPGAAIAGILAAVRWRKNENRECGRQSGDLNVTKKSNDSSL